MIKKGYSILILFLNTFFLIYYIILAFYNNPSQDDWIFMKVLSDGSFSGCLDFIKNIYLHQSGRLFGYFTHCIYYSLFSMNNIGIAIPILSYILSLIIVFFSIERLCHKFNLAMVNISMLFVNVLIICNFEFSSFYWCCATMAFPNNLLYVYAFVLLLTNKKTMYDYIQILITSLFLAFSSEVFTPLFIGLLLVSLVYNYILKNNIYDENKRKWIYISIFVLLVGSIIVIIAPGNYERASESLYISANSTSVFFYAWIKNLMLFFYLLFFKVHYLICFFVVSLLFGLYQYDFPFNLSIKKLILSSILLYAIFIISSVAPMAYLMSSFGFQRFYLPCIMVALIFVFLNGWCIGYNIRNRVKYNHLTIASTVVISCICVCIIYHIKIDYGTVKRYHVCHKERIDKILKAKKEGRKETLYVDSLPNVSTINLKYLITRSSKPVIYYDDEISTNVNDYSNQCLMSYFGVSFPVVLKE